VYYRPVARGLEIKLKDKLDALRAARAEARRKR
jgi:putative ATPase